MITVLLLFVSLGSAALFITLLVAHELQRLIPTLDAAPLRVGDGVVYRKQKVSTKPSPRAYEIHPAGQGDTYSYFVDKYWTVEDVLKDGRVVVMTRTRKHLCLEQSDPNLRKAGLIARLRYRSRFPELAAAA